MTVLEGIQKSAEFLAKKDVESPRLQSELMLAHVLKLPRMQLYLNFERALSTSQIDTLRELVRRRAGREPLQHILGSTSFCGLEIAVNRHVLTPRPETELLAEAGWSFLNQLSASKEAPRALDFGTGSGCIAVALAVKCPQAQMLAVDCSPEALKMAKANAEQHRVSDRIHFEEVKNFADLRRANSLDLIISNPPYIPTGEIETLQPEVRDHDPREALDGGADGLAFYTQIAAEAPRFLEPGGRLMLEFGDNQEKSIQQILENQNWVVDAIREDYTGRPRFLIAKR